MTSEQSIADATRHHVERGELSGAAALVWREGEGVATAAIGRRDLVSGRPVQRDTIFRVASMTKPVTSVAALMLFDEGVFDLDEPITRHAPELERMRVLRDPEGPLDQTGDAIRPITFRDLLTHRSGLTYGDFHHGPVCRAYGEALGAQIDNPLSPDEWIARLATVPLIDQPGAGFHYGLSTDLLGFLIARIEGARLGAVLSRRIFTPLGMRDTGFAVPAEAHERCAALCGFDDEGRLVPLMAAPASAPSVGRARTGAGGKPIRTTARSASFWRTTWWSSTKWPAGSVWVSGVRSRVSMGSRPRDAHDASVSSTASAN